MTKYLIASAFYALTFLGIIAYANYGMEVRYSEGLRDGQLSALQQRL